MIQIQEATWDSAQPKDQKTTILCSWHDQSKIAAHVCVFQLHL